MRREKSRALAEAFRRELSQMEEVMEPMKDASSYYEVERQQYHAVRPGFRINELQISPTQKVPWHYHNNVQDTFYVPKGVSGFSCRIRRRKFFSSPAKHILCRRAVLTSLLTAEIRRLPS